MGPPSNMTEEQCLTLPVMLAEDLTIPLFVEGEKIGYASCSISCWQVTPEEQTEISNNGGKIYLKVIGGQPPVSITPIPYTNLDTSKYDVKELKPDSDRVS